MSGTGLTVYGVLALVFMMAMYALERRGPVFIAAFAVGCALASSYGFLSGAWPFGSVEAVWSLVAARRYWRARHPAVPATASPACVNPARSPAPSSSVPPAPSDPLFPNPSG
ncbi:MAG: hypothetical protein ABJB47_11860 [Actinomycetota bacterium]